MMSEKVSAQAGEAPSSGRLVAGLFMSVDGVVSADGDWQFAYFDEELFGGISAGWQRAGATVMGRRSFEGYRALRQNHPDSPMLAFLDRCDRYVVSRTMVDPQWPGTTVVSEDIVGRVASIREQTDGETLVAGSPSIVRHLLAAGILDELRLTILPILVGAGDRLFPEDADDGLRRVGLTRTSLGGLRSGAVQLTYGLAET